MNVRFRLFADIEPLRHGCDMRNRRGGLTLREATEQLAADPTYQAMRRAKDSERAEVAELRRREQRPVLDDLAQAGVDVAWVGDLCSMPDPNPRIYPILLDHLSRPYPGWLLEWIGRAFSRKTARPIIWDALIDLIRSHSLDERAAAGVMMAICEMAQPRDLDSLIGLLSDPAIGASRVLLVANLMRSKRPAARAALLQHKDDPDLTREIETRLARSRS